MNPASEELLEQLKAVLSFCVEAQKNATSKWHYDDSQDTAQDNTLPVSPERLHDLVLMQHLCNFRLWHVEDTARRRDVGPEVIADCKYRIDGLNQARNDGTERVDACWNELLAPLLPAVKDVVRMPRINTESLGMVFDRLSILSLKIWHMSEQMDRTDVSAEHLANCRQKLFILEEQRRDLHVAARALLDEYAHGLKVPKVYYQCKMYNDPSLNPELYTKK